MRSSACAPSARDQHREATQSTGAADSALANVHKRRTRLRNTMSNNNGTLDFKCVPSVRSMVLPQSARRRGRCLGVLIEALKDAPTADRFSRGRASCFARGEEEERAGGRRARARARARVR